VWVFWVLVGCFSHRRVVSFVLPISYLFFAQLELKKKKIDRFFFFLWRLRLEFLVVGVNNRNEGFASNFGTIAKLIFI